MCKVISVPHGHNSGGDGIPNPFVLILSALGFLLVVIVLTWRFVSGRPMHGRRQTDATFLKSGTRQFNDKDRVYPWTYMAEWKRGLIRVLTAALLGASVWGWFAWPTTTRVLLVTAGIIAVGVVGGLVFRRVRHWTHRRQWVVPLHLVLAPMVGVRSDRRPESWLDVPVGYNHGPEGKTITIHVPVECPLVDRKVFLAVVGERLKLEGWEPFWELNGADPTVSFRMIPRPPKLVDYELARPYMRNAADFAPVIGLGRRNAVVAADLESDSPHILISAGSGGGKSVLARTIAAQTLNKGGAVIFLDRKLISHRWANGLPGVLYCKSIADVHNALVELDAELARRNDLVGTIPDDHDLDLVDLSFLGPRLVIVYEEINLTAGQLKAYWETIREKGDPKKSPAITAFMNVSFAGRAVRIHLVAIGQMLTALATGGPEARESFGIRILSRYSVNNWKMLVPEVWPMPKTPRRPRGRCQVVMGGEAAETQPIFLTDAQAKEWSLEWTERGNPAPTIWGGGRSYQAPEATGDTRSDLGVTVGTGTAVTLREAVDRGIVGLTLDQLQADRKRKPGFPAPIDPNAPTFTYRVAHLKAWEAERSEANA